MVWNGHGEHVRSFLFTPDPLLLASERQRCWIRQESSLRDHPTHLKGGFAWVKHYNGSRKQGSLKTFRAVKRWRLMPKQDPSWGINSPFFFPLSLFSCSHTQQTRKSIFFSLSYLPSSTCIFFSKHMHVKSFNPTSKGATQWLHLTGGLRSAVGGVLNKVSSISSWARSKALIYLWPSNVGTMSSLSVVDFLMYILHCPYLLYWQLGSQMAHGRVLLDIPEMKKLILWC